MNKVLKIWDKMSDTQLKNLACKMYKKYFHHDLKSSVFFSADNPKRCGGFIPASIAFSPNIYSHFDNKEAIITLKHELIHYHLFRKFNDDHKCGHNKYFYQVSDKIGGGGRCAPLSWDINEKDQKKYSYIAKISKAKDNKKLQTLANKVYMKYFHKALHCYIYFDSRISRILAVYRCPSIIINPEFIKNKGDSNKLALASVKHELIHYHLFEKYNDINKCGHTEEFDKLAKKLGINTQYQSWSYHSYMCSSKVAKIDKTTKNPNSNIFFYYSCGIGLYTKPYLMYTGSRIHDKKGRLKKVYYLDCCKYKDYKKDKQALVSTYKKNKHAGIGKLYPKLMACTLDI